MTEKLITACITSIKSLDVKQTRYGAKGLAEVCLYGLPKQTFWVSLKQYDNLEKLFDFLDRGRGYSTNVREAHCILKETERGYQYVWGGIHSAKKSDLKYLEQHFGVTFTSPYIGRIDLEGDKTVEVAAELSDN